MVKNTQTICRQQPKNCLSVFDHFVGLTLKGLSGCYGCPQKYFEKFSETLVNFSGLPGTYLKWALSCLYLLIL